MKALYYCPEYYSNHGGRTHAREFFKALTRLPEIEAAFLYPKASEGVVPGIKQGRLRPGLLLPRKLREFIRVFMPRYELTRELCKEIRKERCNSIIIRTAARRYIVLNRIKKEYPGTVICLEINAVYFEEISAYIPFRRLWQYLEVRRFYRADVISVVSTHLKRYLVERGISSQKIIVNPNGVNEELFSSDVLEQRTNMREKLSIPDDAVVLGYVGGMEQFRRLPEVVDRLAGIRKTLSENLFFVLVGDGSDRSKVEERIINNEEIVGEWIRMMGWVPYEDIPQLMATFDIALFPFTNPYCSPLKLFEYMAMGIPTVGPDVSAVTEVFKDGEHVRLISQDGANFENVLVGLIGSKDIRKQVANRGRMLVLESYTWEKNAQRVVEAIKAVSGKDVT